MRKLNVLILVFLCLWAGLVKASSEMGSETHFPSCSIGVKASTTSSSTICLGGSVSLSTAITGGTSPFTYSWSPVTNLSNPYIANPVATPTVTTTYTVNVTDHAGCTGSSSVTITVNQPPGVNPDTLLFEYITGRNLSARGGVPPYTYNFSPAVNTNTLLTLPDTNTTFTITVTGANGCSRTQNASYVPLNTIANCSSVYISEYVQDTAGSGGMSDAIELYNPTIHAINLNTYYLTGTTGGSLLNPPFLIQLHGTLCPHRTFLIVGSHAKSTLISRANMLSDSLTFNGKDIVALAQATVSGTNVTFSFLDEVGAISPLPGANGWVAGVGSTKNHTLERRSSVTEGTLNWAVGQYQWNTYPQGDISHIARYRSACTLGAPNLTLTYANGQTTCESGSHYYQFDVMVSSDLPSWLDNCVMYVHYNSTAFGSNIVANGNVTVTAYPAFSSPMTYYNPQSFIYDISPDTLGLPLGMDTGIGAWSRTEIDATPQAMMHVKIKVQSCGAPVDIAFVDTSIAQIFSWYTLNQNDSEIDAMSYNYTNYIGQLNDNTCQMAISDFDAPINAGVDSILTITGSGFGTTRGTGQVKFFDADTSNYRMQHLNATDYISWNNTQIKMRLPAFADSGVAASPTEQLTVGGGNFVVKNSCGDSVVSGNNSNGKPFSVYYNLQQSWNTFYTPYQKKELLLRSTDTNGGYILRFDSVTFPKHSIQRLIFTKAMREWECYTGINWTVGKDTNYTYLGPYTGVNYVLFTPHLFLPSGFVARTFVKPDDCPDSINIIKGAITCFNSDTVNFHFIYDTTETVNIPANYFDFYGVCLHELGHFIDLAHSTDPSSLMYWTSNQGPISAANRITLATPMAAAAIDGGIYSVLHSGGISDICDNFPAMLGENTACVNTTSLSSIQKPRINFSVYPNPSKGTFTIQSNINSYTLVVLNMLGQQIYEQKVNGEKVIVSLLTQPNGMYFIQEQYTNGISTQKLIISK